MRNGAKPDDHVSAVYQPKGSRTIGRPGSSAVSSFCLFVGVYAHVGAGTCVAWIMVCNCSSCHFHHMCDVIGARQDVGGFPNSLTPNTPLLSGGVGSLA